MIGEPTNHRIAAGMAALIAVGIMNTPAVQAQAPQARPAASATPKFEVAAIRACTEKPAGRSGGGNVSGGRLTVKCIPVAPLIQQAYVEYANGISRNSNSVPISGGPAWIDSDLYEIEAKAEDNVSREMVLGPMMQTLLEDRFKLKLHRETREIPVYALTVAKSGSELQPFKEGSCVTKERREQLVAAGRPIPESCSDILRKGPNAVADIHGMSLDQISRDLGRFLDRPVIDKTGITGRFDVHLEFAPDEITPGFRAGDPGGAPPPAAASDPAGQSIFTAIQEQLGLKLEPAKGPGEFLVIDSVDRPSEN